MPTGSHRYGRQGSVSGRQEVRPCQRAIRLDGYNDIMKRKKRGKKKKIDVTSIDRRVQQNTRTFRQSRRQRNAEAARK